MTRTLASPLSRFAIAVAVLAAMGVSTSAALAQQNDHEGHDHAAEAAMPPMGRPAEMDQISFMLGNWAVEMNIRMGPGQEWQKSEGRAEVTAVLDGCAQRMDFSGAVMGMPFQGVDHSTYNRETKRFESVWLDNMGARMSSSYGNFNDDGQLVLMGEAMENGMKMKTRTISAQVNENTVSWTMEMSMDGESWFQNMEMTYTRAD
jgi:Protein of unknown function (DUF1579)